MEFLAAAQHLHRLARAFQIVRMHKIEERATQEFFVRVPKRPLERRIHLLEIAINRYHAEQIKRKD